MSSPLAQLIASSKGLPAAFRKDHPIGTVWSGVVQSVTVRQDRDDDGNPKTWDDGNPMQSVVIGITTNQRDPQRPDDDGVRGIYVKWWGDQKKAFLDAIRAAGVADIEVGGMFAAQYAGDGPQPANKMLSPAKLMKFEYKAPSGMAGLLSAEKVAEPPAEPQQTAAVEAMLSSGLGATQLTPSQPVSSPMSGMTAAQPTQAPAAVPAAQPASQPVSPAADPQAMLTQIKTLATMGLTDAQIAAATGADPIAIAAIRNL